jgi:hypothetical protein
MRTQSSSDMLSAGVIAHSRVRVLLRLDGGFEAVLGLCLALSPVNGLSSALQLPTPATMPVVVVVGLLLLPLLPILWSFSRAPRRQFVLALAAANGAGAAIFGLWVLIWRSAFHPAGTIFVLTVATILAILAMLQVHAARPRTSRAHSNHP